MQKRKMRKSKIGAIAYAVFLTVWGLALCYGVYYLWSSVWIFGRYWEDAQIAPKVDAYMERLDTEIWENGENGVIRTISEMEHPYQTNEECVQVLKEILKEDMRCLPGVSGGSETDKIYDLVSGRSKFGQVYVSQKPFEPEENNLVNWAIEKYSVYPWEVKGAEFYLDGLYTTFEITVPEGYTVVLNGHVLTEENIAATGIHYDVLEEYYDDFDGLPTKVTYRAEKVFGRTGYQLLNAKGEPTEIDPERDDSQFIEPATEHEVERFSGFTEEFLKRYLKLCAGTGELWSDYGALKPFIVQGSDLDDRCYRMIDSYWGWQHNSNFNFNGCTVNHVTPLGNGIFVLDVSADAGSQMPRGYTTVHRDMYIYIKYYPEQDQVFAFSVEDYNTEESDYVG